MPKRIQLRRTKGWRKPEGAIVVARPSRWGNPFSVGPRDEGGMTPEQAVNAYRYFFALNPFLVDAARRHLAGRDLACWCPLDQPCHADVLLELANGGER
jgi:hypothetical protein